MKYPVGTLLQFTPKALRKESKLSNLERLIVIAKNTMMVYDITTSEILYLDMFKTQDSYVELASEGIPDDLWVRQKELRMYHRSTVSGRIEKYNVNIC